MSLTSFEPRKIRLHLEALPAETVYLNERFAIPLTIKNDDSIDVALFLDALLQPMVHPGMPTSETAGDYIQLEGEEHRLMSISNALLHESLPAGQTITRFLYLNAVTVPGERVLDISVVAKPASSLEQDTPVAVTEVTRQITLHTVHPLFCDAQPTWYRPETSSRSRKSSLFDLGAPDIEETGYRVLLNILIGSMGPTALVVHDMKLVLFESDKEVKLLGDTLEEDSILEDGMLRSI